MKQTSLLILFMILISQLNSQNIYTKEEIFNFLNGIDVSEETLTSLKNVLADTFKNIYAFNEIAKNPPQPDFDNAYYKPVDIQERMKNVNTKNTNFYTVFQELKKIIAELGDAHIDLNIANLGEIKYSYPVAFTFRKVNDKPKVFAILKIDALGDLFFKFEDIQTIGQIIEKNILNPTPIESINGEDPFEYIFNFGMEYYKAKSPHTTNFFHYLQNNRLVYNFKDYPFSEDDLTSLKIVYENKDEFTTNYLYYSSLDLNSLELKKEIENKIKLFVNQSKNLREKNIEFIKEHLYDNPIKNPMKNFNLNQNNGEAPDYNFNNIFKCRVDHKHKLNFYEVLSFASVDPKYHETMLNCTELFDTNNYPIVVYLYSNDGGVVDHALVLSQFVSPKITINYYGALRKTEITKDTTLFSYFLEAFKFKDYDNCEIVNYSTLIKKEKEIDYGNGVKESIFGPLIISNMNHTNELNEIKKNLKNKRNPTDIIIFTDGFSFSAASMFIKYLQYYGGAITVGYSLNPKLENITFDSGNSPTPVFFDEIVHEFNITGFEELDKELQLTLKLSGIQTFYDPYNLSHPLEYEVTPVDEIVNYYHYLVQPDFDELAEHALTILEKYKTNCNPKNKKLLLFTDKCDGKFKNSYTHGGYVCGEDGNWTETCVASYCDIGYIFDHVKKECIIDACSDRIEPPNNKKNYFKAVILIVVPIIIILILIILLIILIRRKRRNNNEVESIKKTNLTEGLNV